MEESKYLKVKEEITSKMMLYGVFTFIAFTYVIETALMVKIFTIIPLLISLGLLAWFGYSFYKQTELFKKVKKYGKRHYGKSDKR